MTTSPALACSLFGEGPAKVKLREANVVTLTTARCALRAAAQRWGSEAALVAELALRRGRVQARFDAIMAEWRALPAPRPKLPKEPASLKDRVNLAHHMQGKQPGWFTHPTRAAAFGLFICPRRGGAAGAGAAGVGAGAGAAGAN